MKIFFTNDTLLKVINQQCGCIVSKTSKGKQVHPLIGTPFIGETADAPTIFIDGMEGVQVTNGAVKVSMFQIMQELKEKDAPPKRVVVGRLAMSLETFRQVIRWLNQVQADMEEVENPKPSLSVQH